MARAVLELYIDVCLYTSSISIDRLLSRTQARPRIASVELDQTGNNLKPAYTIASGAGGPIDNLLLAAAIFSSLGFITNVRATFFCT